MFRSTRSSGGGGGGGSVWATYLVEREHRSSDSGEVVLGRHLNLVQGRGHLGSDTADDTTDSRWVGLEHTSSLRRLANLLDLDSR